MKTFSFTITYFDQTSTFIVKADTQVSAFKKLKNSQYKGVNVYNGVTLENSDMSDYFCQDITEEEVIAV